MTDKSDVSIIRVKFRHTRFVTAKFTTAKYRHTLFVTAKFTEAKFRHTPFEEPNRSTRLLKVKKIVLSVRSEMKYRSKSSRLEVGPREYR